MTVLTGVIAERLSLNAIPPFLMTLTVVLTASYLFSLNQHWPPGREQRSGRRTDLDRTDRIPGTGRRWW